MGIDTNSHGKKSDKETQAPLLKIFKEIMMREDNDPEKRNLLLDQEKKRKQYSGSRTKVNRKSCESSSSEHRKRSPYKTLAAEQRQFEIPHESQNAFRTEKKGRWWKKVSNINCERDCYQVEAPDCKPGPMKNEDDTCSCVSCALRRIVGSEYACIACLLLLFSISIVAAFCLVYKNVPSANATTHKKTVQTTVATAEKKFEAREIGDSERLKRKIDIINDNLMKNELREEEVFGKPHFDDISADPSDLPGSSEIDFDPSFSELNMLDGGETKRHEDSDLSNIMDQALLNDQSSHKLREFYKKLVQTDAMIKNLKNIKFHNENSVINDDNYESKPPDQFKRSLKVFHYPKKHQARRRRRRDIFNRANDFNNEPINKNKSRLKRFGNETGNPTALVIEKKKLIVQYKPYYLRKLVPKCSHVPKEQHAYHEHQLKHPFYQNTQRLDELLDRFLNKNLPEIVSDPFGFDSLFQQEKCKCKHPSTTKSVDVVNIDLKGEEIRIKQKKVPYKTLKNKLANSHSLTNTLHYKNPINATNAHKTRMKVKEEKITNKNIEALEDSLKERKTFETFSTPDIFKLLDHESSTHYERKFYQHEADMINKEGVTLMTASPNDFELLLSVSTLMNPEIVEESMSLSSSETPLINRVPNIRRLLQTDGEEEENLGYEDFKEVLTDNMENQDDNEGRGERKRRNCDADDEVTTEKKHIPFTKMGSRLSQPIEEKETRPDITTAGDWNSDMDNTTPLPIIKDVYQKEAKLNLPSNNVNNPNWKGPMPLYPDELSSTLKDKSLEINKINMLSTESRRTETKSPIDRTKRKRSDIEYVEDYLDDKYDRLVEMAQAYSDYGVLEGKKDNVRNDKHPATNNKISGDRVKLSADQILRDREIVAVQKDTDSVFYPFCIQNKDKITTSKNSGGIFRILGEQNQPQQDLKGTSEGFRVEVRPSKNKTTNLVSKLLQSHIKLDIPDKKSDEITKTKYTPISVFPKTQLLYSPKFKINSIEEVLKKKTLSRDEIPETPNTLFSINKKRALLSTLMKRSDYDYLQNEKEPLYDSVSDDGQNINSIELDNKNIEHFKIENKRANEISKANTFRKMFKEKNRYLKNIVSKYIHNDNYTNPEQEMVLLNLDRVGSTPKDDLDMNNYVSRLTNGYIWLFSRPYSYTQPHELLTVSPVTSFAEPHLKLYELNSNKASGLEELYQIPNQIVQLNTSDFTVSMEDGKIKPITITTGDTNFLGQLFMSLKHPNTEVEDKLEFEMPFLVNYSELSYDHVKFDEVETLTPRMFPETSTIVVDTSQVVKPIRRFKRNVGTAKTVLEKSNVTINESPLGITEVNRHSSVNDSHEITNSSFHENFNFTRNNTTNNITISDFFMMISNWFKALEGIKVNENKSRLNSGCDLSELLLQLNNKANKSKNENRSSTVDSVYPFYDSELIDNIGHRSRVLLSIQDQNTTESARRIVIDDKEVIGEEANVTGRENNTTVSPVILTLYISVNNSTAERLTATTSDVPKKSNSTSNKVKRNADDSNLISWNDIYDDEYGIQTDNLNNIRDKYSKEHDFIKRSGRWVQDKIKKIAENLKGRVPEKNVKRRTSRAVENVGIVKKLKYLYRKSKRQSDEEEYDSNQKAVFNLLETNLIAVCRKAANAVKQTRNTDVKDNTSQGTLAASLMQQLVRLLTDLVNYQVDQKTCCQLPPDLKVFLEWLTKPEEELKEEQLVSSLSEENPKSQKIQTTPIYPRVDTIDDIIKEKPTEHTSTTENTNTPIAFQESDFGIKYLETLQAVQELLDEYEQMSDEEKSKMTGVKYYLQKQLHHLNNRMSEFDLYNLYEKRSTPLRYKRGLRPRSIKNRRKRKHYKFVRNFGKKHTRTTASYYDGIPISEKKKKEQNIESQIKREHGRKRFKLTVPKRNERNLKDIYYKAVAEAKKYSTALAKNGHNKQQEVDYTVTTRVDK